MPAWCRSPAPLKMVPLKVRLSERTKRSAAPAETWMPEVAEMEPVVPPAPSWSTPADTVVEPV